MQSLSEVVIRKKGRHGDANRVKLSTLDPMLVSELIRDLESITN